MRLPITPQISTKDGVSAKNARLTNCLKESKKTGDKAVIRPGLVTSDSYTGIGNGLIPFDGRLLLIYGDTVYDAEEDSFPWPLDSDEWSAGTTYTYGDAVWYLGNLWFGMSGGNTGNTPGSGSAYWSRSYEIPLWDSSSTYGIGDPVQYNGVTYYSYMPSNANNNPSSTDAWETSAPGSSRYTANITPLGLTGAGRPGAACASAAAAALSAFSTATAMVSCATKNVVSSLWYSLVGVETRVGTTYVRATQFSDYPPYNCSVPPLNAGNVDIGTVTQTV